MSREIEISQNPLWIFQLFIEYIVKNNGINCIMEKNEFISRGKLSYEDWSETKYLTFSGLHRTCNIKIACRLQHFEIFYKNNIIISRKLPQHLTFMNQIYIITALDPIVSSNLHIYCYLISLSLIFRAY